MYLKKLVVYAAAYRNGSDATAITPSSSTGVCVRSLICAICSGITWSNAQANSARTGWTIWMYTISGAQHTNVMPRKATNSVFVWIAATRVIHHGELGSV